MKILFIIITMSLSACANLSSHSDYPSIEQECEMSDDMQSVQCNILAQDDLTQDEKHHLLGYIYWMGVDIEADYAKAKYWFEDAAKQGNAQSINALGVMNFTGQGMQKNNKKAEEYYLLAEQKGSKQAKVNLGELYREGGFGIEQDYDKALYWYQSGIADEPARAYNGLAEMYFVQGQNVKGEENILKAANLDYTEAQYNLGVLYDNGIHGVEQDKEKAELWYRKAAKNGSILAQENLQILLQKKA